MTNRIGMYARFITGMPAFLRNRVSLADAKASVAQDLIARERNFLSLLERAVFGRKESPYEFLFAHAGCEHEEIRRLVNQDGLDAALSTLYDAGVWLSFDEMKGRAPITRGGRTFDGDGDSFENPLVKGAIESRSSGSTGKATRVKSDLANILRQIPILLLAQDANGMLGAPIVLYRPGRPDTVAVNNILRQIVAGNPVRRWFSPVATSDTNAPMRFRLAGAITPPLVRMCGAAFPKMEVVPFGNAIVVARAAAEMVRAEGRCHLRTGISGGLTVAIAARANGVELTGVTISGAGEPPSLTKVRGIRESGARYVTNYAMTEAGSVGTACADGVDHTDVHVNRNRIALLQRPVTPRGQVEPVGMFFLTSLADTSPRILINASSDDFGILEERECGCSLGALGMKQHVRQIRSAGKLTGRGITLVASDIVHIIEEVLPARFGGTAQDYQLVEQEDAGGATHLHLLVSPSITLTDEDDAARVLLEALSRGTPGAGLQSAMLRSARAVSVRREQPRPSARGKLPAFKTVAGQ
jgi:hypothetical protein